MKKFFSLIVLSIILLPVTGCALTETQNEPNNESQTSFNDGKDIPEIEGKQTSEIIDGREKALALYQQKKDEGVNMNDSPCLGVVDDTWAVDIAHDPRLPIDNRPNNQCAAFRNGEVKHVIEISPTGEYIRMR